MEKRGDIWISRVEIHFTSNRGDSRTLQKEFFIEDRKITGHRDIK